MKYICFIAALGISSLCFAQNQTTTFIKSNGLKTNERDSALLIRTITDPEPGSNIYSFTENFASGEPFRAGKTLKADDISPDGLYTVYYPSGKKLSDIVYSEGRPQTQTTYFANGVIFSVSKFTYTFTNPAKPTVYTTEQLIIACNDSAGKALATNGNGHFVAYIPVVDKKFLATGTSRFYYSGLSDVNEEGAIKNEKRDGTWAGTDAKNKFQFTEIYQDGKFVSGKSVDTDGKEYAYKSAGKPAEFPGGIQAFYNYLGVTIRYPASARVNNIQGIVFATFVVEKNGSLTDIKILKSPGNDLSAETVRVLKLSPVWTPGQRHGIPVRQQYTVPVSYKFIGSRF